MSVSPAAALHLGLEAVASIKRELALPDKAALASPAAKTSTHDSVSLSDGAKTAYEAQSTSSSTAPSARSLNCPAIIRDVSSQMRRLSTEATQNRAIEQSGDANGSGGQDAGMAVPLSDTLTADDGVHPSFTPLADGAQATMGDAHDGNSEQTPAKPDGEPSQSSPSDEGGVVDAQAGTSFDHALGKIGHGPHHDKANAASLSDALRLSAKQRDSLAPAHRDGGGHELASAAAQTGRVSRSVKLKVDTPSQATTAGRGTKTYTRASGKG